ncbi:MAG: CotH kinase family protein [Fibrobacterales bacterium]
MYYLFIFAWIALLTQCTTIESYFSRSEPCLETQITPTQSKGDGDIEFSHTRGLYHSSFDLSLNSTIEGTLYYTLNGALPTPENANVYTRPIRIRNSSNIRAAIYHDCDRLSDIVTHSFIFPRHVLEQDDDDAPPHAQWGRKGPDWSMDSRVIDSDKLPSNKTDILLVNPTVSVTMSWDSLFGDNGIYISGEGVEQEASIEFLYPDKPSHRTRASIEVFGGSSTRRWKVDKLSFKLTFRKKTGYKKFKHQLFDDTPIKKFNHIILDAAHNNTFFSVSEKQRSKASYAKDQFAADLHNAIGGYAPHGYYAHLYLNGLYWGLYYIHERPDHHFAQSYLGKKSKNYNVLKHKRNQLVHGDSVSYIELWRRAQKDLSIDSHYESVSELLDIPQYIKYILVHLYLGNTDWGNNNWYATQHRKGKWIFHTWDAEHIMESYLSNRFKKLNNSEIGFHKHLMANKSYRVLFQEVVTKEFYNDGLFTVDRAKAMYETRLNEVESSIIAESARWGDNKTPKQPQTKWDTWAKNRSYVLNRWFPNRTKQVIKQINTHFNEWPQYLLEQDSTASDSL